MEGAIFRREMRAPDKGGRTASGLPVRMYRMHRSCHAGPPRRRQLSGAMLFRAAPVPSAFRAGAAVFRGRDARVLPEYVGEMRGGHKAYGLTDL